MTTHRFTVTTRIAPTAALMLWADLDRITEWMTGVTRVSDVAGRPDRPDFTLPGASFPLVVSPGSRYTIWLGRRPVRIEVLYPAEGQEGTVYRTRLDGSVRRGESLVRFEPDPDGSRVILEVRTEGLVPGIAGRLMAIGAYRGSFRGNLRSFARLAEREHWGQLVI